MMATNQNSRNSPHEDELDPTLPGNRGGPPDISLVEVASVLLRRRRLLATLPILVAAMVVGVGVFLERTYTTRASFLAQSTQPSQVPLRGLAAQFGVTVPTGEVGEGPEFYRELLESRQIVEAAITTEYLIPLEETGDTLTGNLVRLLEVELDDSDVAREVAVQRLRDRISTSTDQETGLVRLTVTTKYAPLSKQIGDRLIALIVDFNMDRRRTQAGAERAFLSDQTRRVEMTLGEAEEALQTFLQRNRVYQDSPELVFEFERLQRRVALQQTLFTSLSQALQQAQISEVRNTPVITVVDEPDLPARPDRRHLILKGIMGGLAGLTLAIFWAFVVAAVGSSRTLEPHRYAEFERLKDETKRDLARVLPRLVRPSFKERTTA